MASEYLVWGVHSVDALKGKKNLSFHRLTHLNISTRASISSNLFPTCCFSSPPSNLGTAACLVEKRSVTDLTEDRVLYGSGKDYFAGDWQCGTMTPFTSRLAHTSTALHCTALLRLPWLSDFCISEKIYRHRDFQI